MLFFVGIVLFVAVIAVLRAPLPLQDQRSRETEL